MDSFEKFWSAYPRRIAKAEARKAFDKAMRKTTLETILSAVESYKKHKPDYCDYAHASTWLNQERWTDEWEPETIIAAPVVRPARTVQEVIDFYRAQGKPVSPEILKAKSVEELPVFARMVPNNVTPMRKAAS